MSPRFTSVLISVFASSALLLTSAAGAAPKKTKADTAKDKAAKDKAAEEEAAKQKAAEEEEAAKQKAAEEEAAKQKADEEAAAKASADKEATDKDKTDKDALVAEAEAGSSPVEQPGKTYYGVGLRYRAIIVPKFMMNLFGDGGRTIVANGIGPEFIIRKNGFEYEFSAMYTGYGMDPTAFKASTDGPDAWEIVESQLKVLYLTADFNWSHEVVPQFAINYGFGAGVGFVFGNLYRTQAYPGTGGDPSTGEGFVKCNSPGNPPVTVASGPSKGLPYCGGDNNHYNGYTEPSWANGGSKPVIFPWLALQTGVRYKPHRNFIARFDVGFATSGFFFGLGADYGL